jgi:hypothetical protein
MDLWLKLLKAILGTTSCTVDGSPAEKINKEWKDVFLRFSFTYQLINRE